LLNITSAGKFTLLMSYIVKGASWKASYDIRVLTDNTIHLTYHGTIVQSTCEDWKNVDLALSTANPSVGGSPPNMPTLSVRFYQPPVIRTIHGGDDVLFGGETHAMVLEDNIAFSKRKSEKKKEKDKKVVHVQTAIVAKVSEAATSATFKIPRLTTIYSDSKAHKVTITIIKFTKTNFEYTIAPKINQNAYLKAKVTNTSDFPLLTGSVAVFFDNTFATSSSIKSASPNEEFEIALGVDPSVKITYKPVHKFLENGGFMSKSNTQTFKYQTEIKNSKSTTIDLILWEQVPVSVYDSIKVKLLQPDLRTTNVTQEKNNNLKWQLKLSSGASATAPLSYSIEYPKEKEIEIREDA